MKLKIKIVILAITLLTSTIFALYPGSVLAANSEAANNLCGSATDITVSPTKKCSDVPDQTNTINGIIGTAINIFSAVVGIVAVIMILVGGFRYITSGGSSDKVGAAKNTIIYGIIGLIIVGLAQVIVQFVVNKSVSAQYPCTDGKVQGGPNNGQAC